MRTTLILKRKEEKSWTKSKIENPRKLIVIIKDGKVVENCEPFAWKFEKA
jgi:hypothetical protein